jgi:hypothetical protein
MMEIELDDPGLIPLLVTFARCIIGGRRCDEVIRRHSSPYMERWYLARKAMIPQFHSSDLIAFKGPEESGLLSAPIIASELENLYIHRYLRSDAEERHCHPWPNASLVLRGWYIEDTPEGQRKRMPGDIVLRKAEQAHAIVEVQPGTLTMFATGQKVREWGFHTDEGWIHHGDFRAWKNAREGVEVISASNAPVLDRERA